MKIALVDDEQKYLNEITKLVCDFCTQCCCQIEIVPFLNGEAFLKAFESGGFSAVFMDIYMDGIDGIAAALRNAEHGQQVCPRVPDLQHGLYAGCLLLPRI